MRYGFLLTVSFFRENTFTSLVSIDEGVLIVTFTSLPSSVSLAELAMLESILIFALAVFSFVLFKVTVVVFPSLLIDADAFTGADKSITIRTYGTGASVRVTHRASSRLAAFA